MCGRHPFFNAFWPSLMCFCQQSLPMGTRCQTWLCSALHLFLTNLNIQYVMRRARKVVDPYFGRLSSARNWYQHHRKFLTWMSHSSSQYMQMHSRMQNGPCPQLAGHCKMIIRKSFQCSCSYCFWQENLLLQYQWSKICWVLTWAT